MPKNKADAVDNGGDEEGGVEIPEASTKVEFETIVRPPDESLDRDSYSRLLERENQIHP